MAKPRIGKEVRKVYTVRLEPKLVGKITKKYGSFSAWVNLALKKEGVK